MRKLINPFKALVFLAIAVTPLLGRASDGDLIEKKRTISKKYTVTEEDRLSIENSFGNVSVTTWNKNEIQVDIEISVRASSDEQAQRMMDEIHVTDNQGSKNIYFKTAIGNLGKGNKNNDNEGSRKFNVDYKVSMPSKNPLHIENSFGKINIPDFAGAVSLTSKFGELITGNIPNAKLIQVEFGIAQIGKLNNADVILKFNNKSSVAGLNGNSKVDVQFCGQVDLTIDDTFTDLALFQSYSSINLKVTNKLSARFDVYTNFGSFENKTNFNIEAESEDGNSGPKFDKNYSGSTGSGAAKIKIKSSFGSVTLMDVNDKSTENDNNDDKDNDKTKVDM